MAQTIRMWRVEHDRLNELARTSLDLESRLEEWLANDIRLVAHDLLVIGRQVVTHFGGKIDLLCIDPVGDLVVVELKRDRTPREITAQALDYASWVCDLSGDRIEEIANGYLGEAGSLEQAFTARFGVEIPEVLNEDHRMLVVGSRIDESTERIIQYLSDNHGVGINAVRFEYFTDGAGGEFVGQVFLLEPGDVEYRARTRGASKRRRNLTYEELEAIAEARGIGPLYRRLVDELRPLFSGTGTTRSNIQFMAQLEDSRGTVFNLIPGADNPRRGVPFQVYRTRLEYVFGLDQETIRSLLPPESTEWVYQLGGEDPRRTGYSGEFASEDEIDRFVRALREAGAKSPRV